MEYSPNTHDLMTCITKKTLVKLNLKAIRRNYHRSLQPEMVDELPDARFVVLDHSEQFNDTTRLTLSLPENPKNVDEGFTFAWVDIRNGDLNQLLTVCVPRTQAMQKP